MKCFTLAKDMEIERSIQKMGAIDIGKILLKNMGSALNLFNLDCKNGMHLSLKELIAALGRRDTRDGYLCNMTDGGEGASGCVRSAETRAKVSLVHKGGKQQAKKQKQR